MDTISTTTRASRNVAAGYTKGYGNLSTTSRGGGLSPAAEQAVRDLGITGRAGMPGGGTLGGIANALGFDVPSAFGTAPLEGMTGPLSQAQLASIANMSPFEAKNAGYGTMPETARAVMAAEQNYGVTLSGTVGYGNGDINPVTGTPMRNGMAVDSGFGPGPAPATYSSVTDMLKTISRGTKAGWRGGYISKETYDNLSNTAKENYNKFDDSHSFTDMGFDTRDLDLDGKTFGKGADERDDTIGFGSGKPSAVFDDPSDFDDDDEAERQEQERLEQARKEADRSTATEADRETVRGYDRDRESGSDRGMSGSERAASDRSDPRWERDFGGGFR
jgi:hypothetical protein